MINAIAIDDEPSALEVLERYAAKVPFVQLKKVFYSTADALAYLHAEPIQLIFLDIQMPDMLGTDFARLIQLEKVQVIFTTAHAEFALEGFDLKALDYLLKPFGFGRFLQACNRVLELVANKPNEEESSIFVKEGYDWVRVNLDEVLYIQSDTNLLFIHEHQRRITTRMTVAEMLSILPPERFVRVHKSYIVALEAVQKIEKHQLTLGKHTVPLAAAYRDAVEERLLRKKK
ncbi:LytR/AlgR family response regulator transcription factor [Haliscomenobacter hydrossis]|uniref:Two component transcriptional regulator, LytTR family n=1 Tax=Haliscomenobacter hydrossis (strain ATCC 27775 / DSM 1100 / LMG 10767 / O) TaxID=760192 RepID=F4KSS5_HALH1|nr:LytTR family DNA-binding domain-containing protein [Haliscomenobacter hydrossis]AEE48039.1 two component transcriptional regulator, LytTR family [Haliscomenobacter hydrossis DSM 1100]